MHTGIAKRPLMTHLDSERSSRGRRWIMWLEGLRERLRAVSNEEFEFSFTVWCRM